MIYNDLYYFYCIQLFIYTYIYIYLFIELFIIQSVFIYCLCRGGITGVASPSGPVRALSP